MMKPNPAANETEAATKAKPPRRTKVTAKSTPATEPITPKGKIATLIDLLRRPQGATVDAMMLATGWQKHSVRGAMSGAIKKDRGLEVTSEKTETGRVYRIAEGAGA